MLEIVGYSETWQALLKAASWVSQSDCTVLIKGETGVGKELIARSIHEGGGRRSRLFVRVDCEDLSVALPGTDVFGCKEDAPTDAWALWERWIAPARQGTLFLDEIGNLPLDLQPVLLQALEELTVRPLGGSPAGRLDVRVIAATNSDLERKVAAGNFREDLYHLLDGAILRVPPLRERRDDIPALAVYFLRKHQPHGRRLRFSGAAERALFNYSWPGNVREMENRVRCAAMFGPGNTIRPKDLRLDPVAWSAGLVEDPAPARGDLEREEIGRAMQATGEDSVLVTNLLWVGKMGKWGPKKGSA